MICQKCSSDFNEVMASCGSGYSWNLLKCPSCEQLYAYGLIPEEVSRDQSIIITYRGPMASANMLKEPS